MLSTRDREQALVNTISLIHALIAARRNAFTGEEVRRIDAQLEDGKKMYQYLEPAWAEKPLCKYIDHILEDRGDI